jgi:hypothetical protein
MPYTTPAQLAFASVVSESIKHICENLVARLDAGPTVTTEHYKRLLTALYYQTRDSSYSFALAASSTPWQHLEVKEYLLKHAWEEHSHWRWILDDLQALGFESPDLANLPATSAANTYVALNRFWATEFGPSRLAIASVLEGFAAYAGRSLLPELILKLGITKQQATFFLSHSVTDVSHTHELENVLSKSSISEIEWTKFMLPAASQAGAAYLNIYSSALSNDK